MLAKSSHVRFEFTNTKKLARIEASSICCQQFANLFADCFCAFNTYQLEFANTSLPTLVCRVKAASLSQVFEEGGIFISARSTELDRFPRTRLTALFFGKKNSISWNKKPGCPGYRILGLCDRDLGIGNEFFSIWTLQPGWPGRNIFGHSFTIAK